MGVDGQLRVGLKDGSDEDHLVAVDDAHQMIAGYCFGTHRVQPAKRARHRCERDVPRWAYRLYDCAAPTDPQLFSMRDATHAQAIQGRLSASDLAIVSTALDEITEHLRNLDATRQLWELPVEDLRADPHDGSEAGRLWSLWSLVVDLPGIGIAKFHKMLHPKRPALIPLIDNKTVKALGGAACWATVRRQVDDPAFADLEVWFEGLAKEEGTAPLTRLRLHDILLWLRCTGQVDEAAGKGEVWLEGR